MAQTEPASKRDVPMGVILEFVHRIKDEKFPWLCKQEGHPRGIPYTLY
jgi:hypothetical protein